MNNQDDTRSVTPQPQPQSNPQTGYWQPPTYAEVAPLPDHLKAAPDTLKPVVYDAQKADAYATPVQQYPVAPYQPEADRLAMLRTAAEKRVQQKEKFLKDTAGGLSAIGINILIWFVISVLAGGPIFFWPIFVILGVGIGIFSNAVKVYGPQPMSDDERERQIQLEMQRMQTYRDYPANQPRR